MWNLPQAGLGTEDGTEQNDLYESAKLNHHLLNIKNNK